MALAGRLEEVWDEDPEEEWGWVQEEDLLTGLALEEEEETTNNHGIFLKPANDQDIPRLMSGNGKFVYLKKQNMMKKKIAIPASDGVLDEHFGHCSHFAIITTEDKNIISENIVDAPPHQPGLLPLWLAEKGVTDVIAGGMGGRAIQIFNQQGVNVFVGAPKLAPADLVKGFLDKTLIFTANYCDH